MVENVLTIIVIYNYNYFIFIVKYKMYNKDKLILK